MEKNPLELVKNDEDAPKIQSVDVDDDPEEIMGCETVGRARIGRRKTIWKKSEESAIILEEFESSVSGLWDFWLNISIYK